MVHNLCIHSKVCMPVCKELGWHLCGVLLLRGNGVGPGPLGSELSGGWCELFTCSISCSCYQVPLEMLPIEQVKYV